MKRSYLFILFLIVSIQLFSQNLVLNPSFEETKEGCAEEIGIFGDYVNNWYTPTHGTSDIFNTCGVKRTGIPYNFSGHQNAEFGNKYAGCFFVAGKNYREYIQGKLASKLEEGKKYKLSFYISLAEVSGVAIQDIGVLFTTNKFYFKSSGSISERQLERNDITDFSLYHIESETYFEDKNQWVQLSQEFVATGNEVFFTIGNFLSDFRTKKKLLSNSKGADKAYYYLDMVSVEAIPESTAVEKDSLASSEPLLISDPNEMEFDKSYIFENIMFGFNSIKLGDPAKEQIKLIYDYLMENEEILLLITGHTDSIGGSSYNQRLSKNRAEAVAEHLIFLGLEDKRIELAAFGKSNPLTTNKTDKGRSLNRRVEFRIQKTSN